ncbi:hypothetical protein BDV59DRAFT_97318 [Aspergillus ambiguus]|uniref:uncharacterized protein n=1 Tax=Aspergillus ambiguus TaxID=176160 RepID=UPI003CCD66E6
MSRNLASPIVSILITPSHSFADPSLKIAYRKNQTRVKADKSKEQADPRLKKRTNIRASRRKSQIHLPTGACLEERSVE